MVLGKCEDRAFHEWLGAASTFLRLLRDEEAVP
jgi:hypothetical protein